MLIEPCIRNKTVAYVKKRSISGGGIVDKRGKMLCETGDLKMRWKE